MMRFLWENGYLYGNTYPVVVQYIHFIFEYRDYVFNAERWHFFPLPRSLFFCNFNILTSGFKVELPKLYTFIAFEFSL